MKKLGLLKENIGISIVALVPDNVRFLANHYSILVEKGAGKLAGFSDQQFELAGAEVVSNRNALLKLSDVVVTHSSDIDFSGIDGYKVVISCYNVLDNYSSILQFNNYQIDFYSLSLLPKTTKARSMAISSSLPEKSEREAASILFGEKISMFINHYRIYNLLDSEDEILLATQITKKGKIIHQKLCDELKNY